MKIEPSENKNNPRPKKWILPTALVLIVLLAIALPAWLSFTATKRGEDQAQQTASAEVIRVKTEVAGLVYSTITAEISTQAAAVIQTLTAQPSPTASITPTPVGPAGMALPGSPCISYYDNQQADLVFTCLRGETWLSETVDSKGDVGLFSSLAFDANRIPHISYYDSTNAVLKYAYAEPGGWHVEVVDGDTPTGMLTSLALDAEGNPMISYFDKKSRYLKFARRVDDQWEISKIEVVAGSKGVEGIDKGGIHYTSSLALDPQGNPAIAFYNHPQYSLKIARWQDGKFFITPVDRESVSGRYCSLAFDPAGNPLISYYFYKDEWASYRLKLARWDGTLFKSELIGETWESGKYTSLALAPDGTPHIIYMNEFSYDLRHAAWQDGSWGFETLAQKDQSAIFPSVNMGKNGNLFVAFGDTVNKKVQVIQVLPTRQTWDLGAGGYPSLKIAE